MENRNEVTPVAATPLTDIKLLEFLQIAGVGSSLTPTEKKSFVEIAQAYQLNPFKREIYCTTYGEGQFRKTSIITGYEVYIKRAERTGKLDGWSVSVTGNGNDMIAEITINRKDWKQPFKHEVYFQECAQKKKDGTLNSIWGKMPRFMTKKVAIAQGFRLCFSDELGGMPYTADELPQGEIKGDKVVSETVIPEVIDTVAIPADIQETLESATNRAELKALCQKFGAENESLKPSLSAYYKASNLK